MQPPGALMRSVLHITITTKALTRFFKQLVFFSIIPGVFHLKNPALFFGKYILFKFYLFFYYL